MAIKFALFKNYLTSDPDDYMAVVQNQQVFTREDIVKDMIERGSTVTKADALSTLQEFEESVKRLALSGGIIQDPLFRIGTSIKGVFNNITETFNRSKHYVRLNIRPGRVLKEITGAIKVEKVEATSPSPNVQQFKDFTSKTIDEIVTPGGVGELIGNRLKIEEEDLKQGIYFIDINGIEIRATEIVRNKPRHLIFVIPEGLVAGAYDIEVRATIYNTKTIKKGQLNANLIVV